jgi:hypothetical protein
MRKAKIFLGAAFFALTTVGGVISALAGMSEVCPNPPEGLAKLLHNPGRLRIDGQTDHFSERSIDYPIDIYSAFAPRDASPNSSWCIRYEVINKGPAPIEMLYWPLASSTGKTKVLPNDPISLVRTEAAGDEPILDETWIYAFRNESLKTRAFQKRHSRSIIQRNQFAWQNIDGMLSPNLLFRPVAFDGAPPRISFQQNIKLSPIGSEILSSRADGRVSAISMASFEENASNISVTVERTVDKVTVRAPVTYALAKSDNPSSLLRLVREFKDVALPFDGNTFKVNRPFPLNMALGWSRDLYVIEQPIMLEGPGGKTCFLAPVYAPMPIPDDLLRCDPF